MSKPLTAADRGHPAHVRGQKSFLRPTFPPRGGRGRSVRDLRRAHRHLRPDPEGFMRRWSMLMIVSFPDAVSCGRFFGVTKQTACNWRDATHRPYGDAVDFAMRTLPDYQRVMLS